MMFQSYPTRSSFIFSGIAIVSAYALILLLTALPHQSDLNTIFKLLVALLIILVVMGTTLYGAIIAFKLHYLLNRNGIVIQWGLAQQLIPFETIQKIIPGKNVESSLAFTGLNIAGLRFGRGELTEYGPVKFFTTSPVTNTLLIVTANESYLISPRTPDNFIKAWQTRQKLGPTQHWEAGIYRSWPLNSPLLTDPLLWWLLGGAILAYLALFGYFSFMYSDLSAHLPIHFDAQGYADRFADKSRLVTIPVAGLIVLTLNALLGVLLYRWEKLTAYLLWGSAIVMQICLWVALLTITA